MLLTNTLPNKSTSYILIPNFNLDSSVLSSYNRFSG